MERKSKTTFQLETPFSEILWPQIAPKDQETIFELLLSILAPLGAHRTLHVRASKGKRSNKRKRVEIRTEHINTSVEGFDATPPKPDISMHVLVGLNSITKHLELLSRYSKPKQLLLETAAMTTNETESIEAGPQQSSLRESALPRHIAAVFVCRSSQPSVLHAHLTQLTATASFAHSELPQTRLVQLPKGCESRLCSCLGLSHASFVALLEDAPHSKPLIEFVRTTVPPIDVKWLKEAQSLQFRPTKINTILTMASTTKKSKGKG